MGLLNWVKDFLQKYLLIGNEKIEKPASLSSSDKEEKAEMTSYTVSPWKRRRWRFKRTNHPWFRNRR